jgi:hypothetical protein
VVLRLDSLVVFKTNAQSACWAVRGLSLLWFVVAAAAAAAAADAMLLPLLKL